MDPDDWGQVGKLGPRQRFPVRERWEGVMERVCPHVVQSVPGVYSHLGRCPDISLDCGSMWKRPSLKNKDDISLPDGPDLRQTTLSAEYDKTITWVQVPGSLPVRKMCRVFILSVSVKVEPGSTPVSGSPEPRRLRE